MALVEMVIDSIRHAMHNDEWVILLKDKAGQRYLPVYVDKACADMIAKALRDEKCDEVVDNEVEKVLAMTDSVSLVIDSVEGGAYHTSFNVDWCGKSHSIECPIGKRFILAVKAGADILVEEKLL